MQISEVIQHLKNGSSLNISHDLREDFDYVYHINVCLVDIFSQLNSMGNRFFSNVTEVITVPDVDGVTQKSKVRVLANDISRFWEVKGDGVTIDQVNVSLSMTHPDEVEETPGYVMTGSKNIETAEAFHELTVIYSRFPKRHPFDDTTIEADMPAQLLGVLEFLVFWRLMPVFFEQGSSLANNYLQQADKQLVNYAANIGLSSKQTRFTA